MGGRYVLDPAILDFLAHPTALLAALDVDAAFALLQRIDEAHEGGVVAAWAKYWFARSLVLFRKEPEDAPQVAGLLAAAERDAAGTLLAERIAAPRFERERLQVGLPVPELAGEDMEGRPLALSSYRGKVVVLCFWSFDNNVARGAVPVQAQLAKRLEGRPFALVGVCSDTNKAHYANGCKVYGVTWRSFWGGPGRATGTVRDALERALPADVLRDRPRRPDPVPRRRCAADRAGRGAPGRGRRQSRRERWSLVVLATAGDHQSTGRSSASAPARVRTAAAWRRRGGRGGAAPDRAPLR